jgi:hypothetical protein
MLLIGAVGMAVCHIIVAGTGVGVSSDNKAGQNCLVAFVRFRSPISPLLFDTDTLPRQVCIFIAFFAATWGAVSPSFLSFHSIDLFFPSQVRCKLPFLPSFSRSQPKSPSAGLGS